MNLEQLNTFMVQNVPFNRVLGIQVEVAEAERVEVIMPEVPERLNHVGSIHAAAQCGLGEATSGAMVVNALSDLLGHGLVPLATEATIKYRRPAHGTLRGIATLAADEQTLIRKQTTQTGRADFTVAVQMVNSEGKTTAEMQVTWAVLRPRS